MKESKLTRWILATLVFIALGIVVSRAGLATARWIMLGLLLLVFFFGGTSARRYGSGGSGDPSGSGGSGGSPDEEATVDEVVEGSGHDAEPDPDPDPSADQDEDEDTDGNEEDPQAASEEAPGETVT